MKSLVRLAFAGCLLVSSALAGEVRVAVLQLEGMQCYGCVQTVKQALHKVPGVQEAVIDLDKKTATVRFDSDKTNAEALTKATAAAGFPSSKGAPDQLGVPR